MTGITIPVATAYTAGAPAFQHPDIVSAYPFACTASGAGVAGGIDNFTFARLTMPRAGILSHIYLNVGTTGAGNIKGLIYSIGPTCTRLWAGGATVAALNWLSLGNPALTVLDGEIYWVGYTTDSATMARRGPMTTTSSSITSCPPDFVTSGLSVLTAAVTAANGASYASPPASFLSSKLQGSTHVPAIGGVIV